MAAEARLSQSILAKYMALPQVGAIQLEYVWIGGTGMDLRSKTRTWTGNPNPKPSELPIWNFDGSSTGQAPGHDSEVLLRPAYVCPDPFRGGNNKLVLCDCLTPAMEPLAGNTRTTAKAAFDAKLSEEPWFGLEQEYTLFHLDGKTPLGWPKGGYPGPQGPYYCSAGADVAFGRAVVEAHYRACLYAGVKISGINAEVLPGQWEYQIGPCTGIESGDHCWLARYIMQRVCEDFGVLVSFEPKPIPGDWNGSGCHSNYSTKAMREEGGYKVIIEAIEKLGKKHSEHIAVYGQGNEARLTGKHETASIHTFLYGVANRGASIRIPRDTERDGKGYFEDRRPASNCDPYVVTAKIFETTCL
jgi:glutamine synthetase